MGNTWEILVTWYKKWKGIYLVWTRYIYLEHEIIVKGFQMLHATIHWYYMCRGLVVTGQGIGLAVVWSPVWTLPPRDKGGALVVWPGCSSELWWWNTSVRGIISYYMACYLYYTNYCIEPFKYYWSFTDVLHEQQARHYMVHHIALHHWKYMAVTWILR